MLFRKGLAHDIRVLYGLCQGVGVQTPESKTFVNSMGIQGLLYDLYQRFPHDDGMDQASPFKKAAAYLCHWLAAKPIIMKPDPYGDVNAKVGLHVALRSLEGSSLTMNGKRHTITAPLELSEHSLLDIVDALTHCEKPVASFKFVAVLLEQITYKTNPHCQYPDVLSDAGLLGSP